MKRDGMVCLGALVVLSGGALGQETCLGFPGPIYGAFEDLMSMTVADIDMDGVPDVLVGAESNEHLYMLTRNAMGGYEVVWEQDIGARTGEFLEAGDLDGDGDLDVVSLDRDDAIFFRNNGGTLSYLRFSALSGMGEVGAFALIDLTGDGACEIVAYDEDSDDTFVYVNDGAGNFGVPNTFYTEHRKWYRFADINLDGHMDMLLGEHVGEEVLTYLGDSSGSFGSAVVAPVKDVSVFMQIADIDNDGVLDLVTSLGNDSVGVVMGFDFDETVEVVPDEFPAMGDVDDVELVDIDGDGFLDVVITRDSGYTWMRNDGTGAFVGETPITHERRILASEFVDLDGDGDADAVQASNGYHGVAIVENYGAGGFDSDVQSGVVPPVFPRRMVDLNGDGLLDLISAGTGSLVSAAVAIGDPFTFGPRVDLSLNQNAFTYELIDVDADSDLDLVVPDANGNRGRVYINRSGAFFNGFFIFQTGGVSPLAMEAMDLDGDFDDDLVFAGSDRRIYTAENAQLGELQDATGPHTDVLATGLGRWDVDNDGDNDVVYSHRDLDVMGVLLNDGSGGLTALVEYDLGVEPRGVAAADVDMDGDLDLVVLGGSGSARIGVYPGNGDGTFGAPIGYDLFGSFGAGTLRVEDITGDGFADILMSKAGDLVVLVNDGAGVFTDEFAYQTSMEPGYFLEDLDDDGVPDLRMFTDYGLMTTVYNGCERTPCPADLTGDFELDFFDVSALLTGSVDYNGDTSFDFFDISDFLQAFGAGCP